MYLIETGDPHPATITKYTFNYRDAVHFYGQLNIMLSMEKGQWTVAVVIVSGQKTRDYCQ